MIINNLSKEENIKRIECIEKGADFGEVDFGDAFANAYFKYKLVKVVNKEKGIICVVDTSQYSRPKFETNVYGLYIHGIDKLSFEN